MIRGSNEPSYPELYRIAGEEWADLESAASLLENTKTAVLEQRKAALGKMPVNRAEMIVKSSPEWHEHLKVIEAARRVANIAKVNLEAIKMEFYRQQSKDASARTEMRMLGDIP